MAHAPSPQPNPPEPGPNRSRARRRPTVRQSLIRGERPWSPWSKEHGGANFSGGPGKTIVSGFGWL